MLDSYRTTISVLEPIPFDLAAGERLPPCGTLGRALPSLRPADDDGRVRRRVIEARGNTPNVRLDEGSAPYHRRCGNHNCHNTVPTARQQ